MRLITALFLSLFYLTQSLVRECPDQAEACEECPESGSECEFTFNIHERFSFVSYELDENKTLGENGYLYFLNASGYQRAVSGDAKCNFDGATTEDHFTSRGCSVPMTLDGVNYRTLLLINGRVPGPTIIVYEGQTVVIHVFNHLTDVGVTIHWHGMFQRKSVWMDGVSHITQSPIDPDASFDYIFKAEPAGTHWYHSHAGSQKSDGIFGAFIVRERRSVGDLLQDSRYTNVEDMPDSHTLSLTDWQRKPEAIHQALSTVPFFTDLPIGMLPTMTSEASHRSLQGLDGSSHGPFPFWSGLINGRGRKENNTLTPLSTFSVVRGRMYRFRIIGAISIFPFKFSIDGHKLIVISSDGDVFQPKEVDYIVIHSGETYDFILNANQNAMNYWIRADTLEDTAAEDEHSARGILTYGNANQLSWTSKYSNVLDVRRSCTEGEKCKVLNCPYSAHPNENIFQCVSLIDLVSISPDSQLPIFPPKQHSNLHFLNFGFTGRRNTINVNRFKAPALPYATNCGAYDQSVKDSKICGVCTESKSSFSRINQVCECVNVIQAASNAKYVESAEPQSIGIVISAKGAGFAHPIHLHGHAFHVVYIGNTSELSCAEKLNGACTRLDWANGTMPQAIFSRLQNGRVVRTAIKKDTVIVAHDQYVVIAFLADNPGYWFMHCHVEEHLLDGMAVIIQEYSADQQWTPPSGINNHGSFQWSVAGYNSTIGRGSTCNSDASPTSNSYILVTLVSILVASFYF